MISVNSSLLRLNLADNNISENAAGLILLAVKVPLSPLSLFLIASLPVRQSNTVLQELSLRDNPMGEGAGKMIGKMLKENSTLLSLDINNIELGLEGAHVCSACLTTKALMVFRDTVAWRALTPEQDTDVAEHRIQRSWTER